MHDILTRSALAQAQLVQSGQVSAEELARAYLDRIEAHNPRLGAFTYVARRAALAQARALPRQATSPLSGVPVGIKDLNFVRGMKLSGGSRGLSWFYSPIDDDVARRTRAAGMVVLGKLATSELGILPFVETSAHPPARNPHAPEHTSGGSSGGSGTAVGAGLLPLAHGSDAAGSIRIPAAFCGLVGFKPSRGALVSPHARVDIVGIAVEGPLARTVEDAAAYMDVLAASPSSKYLEAARRPTGRLRVRFAAESPDVGVSAEAQAEVRRAARALASLGHEVEEAPMDRGDVAEFLPLMQFMTRRAPVVFPWLLQPVSQWMRRQGKAHRREDVLRSAAALEARVQSWFGDVDVWLTPTVALEAPRVGAFAGLSPEEVFHRAADLGRLTAPYNVGGMPAVSLPTGRAASGLPLAIQLGMRRGRDGELLALARALEDSGLVQVTPPALSGA